MEPETYYAKSGGLRIAYQVMGEGPDLVMVPGLTSHLEIQWRDPSYRRFVRSLSSFCRLVRFDKPGTGLSDPVAEPPTLDERVADLIAVMSAARCRRPVVLGFSDGGPVAVALAAAHRRSVRALVLYGTSPRRPPGWVMRQLRVMARQWGQGDSLGMFAPTLVGELARHDRAVFERASASPGMIRALVESLTVTDVRSRLAEVTVPALVLHRRSDFVPFSEAELMTRGIRGARLVELEGSDHLPWVGDASGVLSPIAEFVREVSGRNGKRVAAVPAARTRRPVTGWEALTDAERRVAHLVAEGLAAATQAGVEVEMGVSVHGLLREGGRVTGVRTSAGERCARLVIGADGRNSRIARLAGAKTYHDHPPVTFAYYSYWRGCPVTGVHAWLEPGRFFGIFPVGDGLALAFVQGPRGEYPTFRRDPLTAYVSELRSRPALAGLLAEAVIAEHLRGTAALPTFFRVSSGPGWALVGDAGHHKDPVIARGIADAFRDADLVASAVVDGWHGDLEAALAEYGRQRDRCAIPLSDANLGLARLDLAAGALGAAWFQMNGLEQALDDPAAVSEGQGQWS